MREQNPVSVGLMLEYADLRNPTGVGKSVFENACCGDHPQPWKWEDIEGVIASAEWCCCFSQDGQYGNCGSYCDSSGVGVYLLKNGNVLTMHESSDSSGHGCQCSGQGEESESLAQAIQVELTDQEKDKLGLVKRGQ